MGFASLLLLEIICRRRGRSRVRAPAAAWDVPGACHGAILSPSDNPRQCGMLQPWRLGRHSSPALPEPARGMRFKPLVQKGAGSFSRVRADGMGVSWSIRPRNAAWCWAPLAPVCRPLAPVCRPLGTSSAELAAGTRGPRQAFLPRFKVSGRAEQMKQYLRCRRYISSPDLKRCG